MNPGIAIKTLLLAAAVATLTACSAGGDLTLEPGVRKPASGLGSPFVQVNLGGKALVIEQGKTATTGVHGWVTVQPVKASNLSSSNGTTATLNKTQRYE